MGENQPKSSAAPVRRRIRLNTKKQHNEDEFMAAAIGDTEWLRQSIRESRGEIHYDKNGLAPIHLASIHGRLDCIKLLVEKFKVDVNLPSTTGWRPIHLCISNQTGKRSFACLVYLLEHDADPNITNDDGVTPVHQAASEGHVQCLKLLIEIGATIDGMDCRGHTPIVLAKLWGHRKSARILAAEQWSRDKDHVAKEMNQLKKVKMLQVLQEMEEEDVHKAEQKFYGDAAFKNWLGEKGLKTTPAKPQLTQKEKQDQAKKAAAKALAQKEQSRTKSQKSDIREEAEWRQQSREHTRESLFKANSRTQTSRHMDTFPIAEVEQNGNISPKKVQIITKEDVTGSPLPPTRESTKRLKTASTDTSWGYNLHESQAPGYEIRESTQHTDTEKKEILAAEQWSRDKDHVAKEMNQLKKVKMLQVLQEMEEEDVHKAEQKFYGDAAFKNWLGEKGLKTTPAKPKLTQKEKQDQAKKAAAKALAQKEQSRTKSQKSDIREEAEWRQQSREHTRESLFKANSRTLNSRPMDTFPIAEVEQNGYISPKKVQIITKEDVTGSPLPPTRESTKRLKTASTDTSWGYNLHESQAPGYETRESTQHTDTEKKESFYNPLAWNKSTKTPVPEHVSRLRDAYPRDFYTMMPHKDAAPKELNIRQGPVVELDEKSGLKSVRMPDLPRDVIMKALAKDPLKYERPVLYRCKNIIDAQTKKKYTPDNSPSRSEAGIHLSDDLRSHLVQSGLERAVAEDLMRTFSAGRSGLSSTTDSEVERMVQTMKRMAKPSHFPNTGGEEYDINFGNLTCI
ncbi:inversin [Lingula anatina]|uniref:Inversin n=1 Tax=Lingula anatina TaxID=7574 RepID=A0A1S3KDY8_LINAN|nr:inversin [Lingula anatina]|eukprot:XP_013420712.1 inversin [Lingula anatina]